ncbi:outer membrane protein [Mangrovibrevibacter kandeliae]|uniref:outer membrane protein n=1 Tax=Mangrovibrevibacter kandeliae TaxID=2968473 RepID=UPI0021196CC3|nr:MULTISPECIES: outer membrane protein [unclassified Aurantimonas]MCQ8784245.1 porin family protein [Aurantimonas sp. CSK15Z-1]MCW4116913.1 porin family protein [Aurantimonas sp. MSK8Z-1]
MQRITAITMLACGLMAGVTAAQAADLVEEQPIYEQPAPQSYSNWYIRGDVGYLFKSKTSGDYYFYNQPFPGIDSHEYYDSIELKNNATFGAGAGFRLNDYVRGDVTVDYFKTDVKGSSECSYLVEIGYGLDPVDNDCRYNDSSKASVWMAMANAYVDVGHFGIVTPYLGAGAGFAWVKYDDMNDEIACSGGPCGGDPDVYRSTHPGESSVRFAASLMAGASFDLTQQLKLDAGYRYTRISEGDAFGFDADDRSFGASGVQGRDHGFNLHQIRAGLRYEFN